MNTNMNTNDDFVPQSIIYSVASVGVRLLPRGRNSILIEADYFYNTFNSLYRDTHPDVTSALFFKAVRQVFPVYKNPRKQTDIYKITTHKLRHRLFELGMEHFPIETLANKETLKIEMR